MTTTHARLVRAREQLAYARTATARRAQATAARRVQDLERQYAAESRTTHDRATLAAATHIRTAIAWRKVIAVTDPRHRHGRRRPHRNRPPRRRAHLPHRSHLLRNPP